MHHFHSAHSSRPSSTQPQPSLPVQNTICGSAHSCSPDDGQLNSNFHSAHSSRPSSTQPQSSLPVQNTICAVHILVLLMMGVMMPETCWDKSLIIDIRLVASCWFLALHPTFMMHGHKSLKNAIYIRIWDGVTRPVAACNNLATDRMINETGFDYRQEQSFSVLSNVQTCPAVHPSPYVEGTARPVPGIQRPGSEADHSRHFVPCLRRSTLDCTTTSVLICMVWCLSMAGLIPKSLQLQARVTLESLGSCHKQGKVCKVVFVYSCSEGGGGVSIRVLT